MAATGANNAWYKNGKAVWQDGETYWQNALQYAHADSETGVDQKKIIGYGKQGVISAFNLATGTAANRGEL